MGLLLLYVYEIYIYHGHKDENICVGWENDRQFSIKLYLFMFDFDAVIIDNIICIYINFA